MAYKITDDCISCGSCAIECPNSAITETASIFVIDPNKCTECVGSFPSSQCADFCPVDAAQPDPAHRESREQLLEKWRRLHPGETPKL